MRIFKKYHLPGTSPGTLTPPEAAPLQSRLTLVAYDAQHFEERRLESIEECLPYRDQPYRVWISVEGLGQVEVVEKLGQYFGLHPLALEDVLNVGQRAKYDDYDDYLFVILPVAAPRQNLEFEQVSLFLGRNFVISIGESLSNGFEPVRERLRKGRPAIRSRGTDYLAYALIDSVIDTFFPVVEQMAARTAELDDQVTEDPSEEILHEIHDLKGDLLDLRRVLRPTRDMITTLIRDDTPLIPPQTEVYLRDCHDHAVQILETVDTYRDLCTGIMEVYLSTLSKRMNEVMKVLTVIATIFIPLTFIVGIYGMNFNPQVSPWNMPELNAYYGYPITMGIMLILALGMLLAFKKRGWL